MSYHGTFPLFTHKTYRALFMNPLNGRRRSTRLICTYAISNTITGSVYVGSTLDFYARWQKHVALLRRGQHTNLRLQEELNEVGQAAFTITLLQCFTSTVDLLRHEVRAAHAFSPELLLNYRIGTQVVAGWLPKHNQGQGRAKRPRKFERGPQSKSRWFDFVAKAATTS